MTAAGSATTWRPTPAFTTATVAGLVLVVYAGFNHRPSLVLLAVPLLAEVAWALRRVARPPVGVRAAALAARVREGDDVGVGLVVDAPDDADLVLTAVGTDPLLDAPVEHRPLLALPEQASRTFTARAVHWGAGPAARTYAVAWAGHGLLRSTPVIATAADLLVEPAPVPIAPVVPTRRTGVAGPRVSRRPGEGSELTGVRPFVAGDRLRQVHWRVTARRGDLHVTTTAADREASVLLAVDSGSELGPTDSTTLDVAVRIAAGLAHRHLHDGDRVGFVDLGDPTRVLRPAPGRRQVDRVVDRLLRTRRCTPAELGRLPAVVARTAPGALVVVLSPLLRPTMGAAVARLAQTGAAVTVVDTLDRTLERSGLPAAQRLVLLQRDATLDLLADVGVAVRPWR